MEQKKPLLNVEQMVRGKVPKQAEKVPGFVFRFAEWLVCQKQLNALYEIIGHLKGADFAEAMCSSLNVKYHVEGMENIPDNGQFIFVSNHPLGAFDGISYINIFGKRYQGKFKVIVNDLLMYIPALHPVFLPVNTLGKQKRADMEAIQEAFADPEMQIMSFPAGFCSRFMGGKIQDVAWKKSVINQAIEHQRDIIPMRFIGRNSITFYGIEWLRRVFGMKFNIGLILLPWQMAKTSRNKTYSIYIGKPIPWQTFTENSRSATEWAQWLRSECYKL